jgi:hypothetical protein
MGRSARLVLIGHVSGLSGVASLDPFVCITLHLLVGLASLEPFVYIAVHLLLSLLTRCGLLLLRRCGERNRASAMTIIARIEVRIRLLQCLAPVR